MKVVERSVRFVLNDSGGWPFFRSRLVRWQHLVDRVEGYLVAVVRQGHGIGSNVRRG